MDDWKHSGVVIVRSHSARPVTEIDVKRPGTMPGRLVIFCSHKATDSQIIDACMGVLSDEEMARMFEYFGVTIDPKEQP